MSFCACSEASVERSRIKPNQAETITKNELFEEEEGLSYGAWRNSRTNEENIPVETFHSLLAVMQVGVHGDKGILYPRSSIIRESITLDGLWEFSLSKDSSCATTGHCFQNSDVNDEDVELMPVPASYNDVSTNTKVRDHVGIARYYRRFVVPQGWQNKTVWLRFGSVCYAAEVYINEQHAVSHQIGHLPFEAEVTSLLKVHTFNNITVLVNNTLTNTTVPQGEVETLSSGRLAQTYTFDFFNYAGIDRSVVLYTTADTYIDDITITTTISGTSGIINYDVVLEGNDIVTHVVTVIDKEGNEIVSTNESLSGTLEVPEAILWWPYLMNENPGYLYTLRIDIFDEEGVWLDRYDQPFGIRELYWDNTSFKINGKPLYLRGFGRHEDSDIRGKGFDLPLIIRDHNLIKWIGANSYRTSHYPYAEEIMDLADSLGIMIVDECPAVNTEEVIAHVKSLDTTRPVTVVNNVNSTEDHSGQFIDILSFNKYSGWYEDEGDLDVVVKKVVDYAEAWHTEHNKPVLITEYGADTLEGLHFVS
ncbi:hypothetical protein NQ318_022410 [Aromia moschata]|uniref:Beta-glucuronidase n=1 Tax=Aromia moschata TaxID=1265417 RepID=A0AAV8Z4N3_9CUCU|nr:hypothetical protein NQ318_022410 [Aromia moschata]